AVAPRFFEAALPASERSRRRRAGVEHIPRIAVVIAFRFDTMEFAVGDNWTVVVQSGSAHGGAEILDGGHAFPWVPGLSGAALTVLPCILSRKATKSDSRTKHFAPTPTEGRPALR